MEKNKLSWFVYYEDFNRKEIKKYDIFAGEYLQTIASDLKAQSQNKEGWAEAFRKELMYRFWSKAEWEIVLTSWPPYVDMEEIDRLNNEVKEFETKYGHKPYHTDVRPTVGWKIDIYDQITLNWEAFVDYVWARI